MLLCINNGGIVLFSEPKSMLNSSRQQRGIPFMFCRVCARSCPTVYGHERQACYGNSRGRFADCFDGCGSGQATSVSATSWCGTAEVGNACAVALQGECTTRCKVRLRVLPTSTTILALSSTSALVDDEQPGRSAKSDFFGDFKCGILEPPPSVDYTPTR